MNCELPSSVEMEDVSCPNGCLEDDKILFSSCDRLHGLPGEFNIVRCTVCGLMRTNPRPTQETIGYYYPVDYGPFQSTVLKEFVKEKQAPSKLKRRASNFFKYKVDVTPVLKPGRMLEIGCASGKFLHRMEQRGWVVEGIEYSPDAAKNAKALGYSVHVGPVETAPEPELKYDLFVGWMVLEHLHEPLKVLNKLYRWANPDAYLVLSVPNAASKEFLIFNKAWYALQLPTHLYHFTPDSLTLLLENSGWEVVQISHQRVLSNLFPSIGYKLEDLGIAKRLSKRLIEFNKNPGRMNQLLYPLAFLFAKLGQTGRMTIWAKRIDN